jgi:Zn ribbon nucleic-acid-binding protein
MSAIPERASARCPNCQTVVSLLEWSESVRKNETTRIWRCIACGHEFETKDDFVEQEPSNAELAEEFLPNLVVE